MSTLFGVTPPELSRQRILQVTELLGVVLLIVNFEALSVFKNAFGTILLYPWNNVVLIFTARRL